ncbi:MAG: adenylate/guanylate cyclase domain-containing protein [Deltaproteobacteria bacterium]|nr:adenylate/guanylate cyclase domain-containing protein [Deltaproteobacteria bacterium]
MPEDSASALRSETRRLAAIMFTDIVGFSHQMGADEARMLRLLDIHNQIIKQAVTEHHGTIIKTVGDAFLVDFPSVVNAVQCAQRIQTQFRSHNDEKEAAEQIHVRIGIHSGDIVQRDGDVFGDGVNIASRLQTLAEPDTICLSQVVYKEVEKKLLLGTVVSLGRPKLKGIAERFPIYALLPDHSTGLPQALRRQGRKLRRVGTTHLAWAGLVVGVLIGEAIIALLSPSLSRSPQPEIRTHETLPLPDKPSIVVLPFVNLSGDSEQEYFSDGITEELTASLSQLSSLFVISRNSAFTYKGKVVKAPDISKDLGVKYVLEGSIRRAGNQVRVTVQLIDAVQDNHLWAERYDRPMQDLFALQDEIVQKIVTTLKLQLTLTRQGLLVRKRTENLEAYDYYLRSTEAQSRAIIEGQQEANESARQLFEHVLELDPTFAEAYARLGITYILNFSGNKDPAQSMEQAFALEQKALALDDSLPLAHSQLGWIYLYKKQHEQALAEAEQALVLDPNWANGYRVLGTILTYAGRPEEGIGVIEKGLRLSPRYPVYHLQGLGFAYRVAGRCAEAIAASQKALSFAPTFLGDHVNLAICYAELGREEEARAEVAEILRLNPNSSLEGAKRNMPFKDPAMLERELGALRKAGLK